MAGIPIRVNRTYDSRRRAEELDFGFGWSIDYQNVRIEESRAAGIGWELNETRTGPFGAFVTWCVEPRGAPVVSVTLPDERVETFEVRASPECTPYIPTIDVQLQFVPVDGTLSTLTQSSFGTVRLSGDNLVELGVGQPVDPNRYTL